MRPLATGPARVVSDQTLGGSLLSARQYDDTVRLVVRTGYPTLEQAS